MILNLKGVFECEGYTRDFSYEYDMSGYEDQSKNHPFIEPVKVQARLVNRAGVVSLHTEAHFDYFTQCDRCCSPLKEHFDYSFDNVISKRAKGEGENGDIIVVKDDSFDLDELVLSGIILNLPMKHLCGENCKGLCPVCGKNLNDGECGCGKSGDSPFSVLKDLSD